jgi:uncharacterized DUF497 family protein
MRFDWDDNKSQQLEQRRGWPLAEIVAILSGDYVERVKSDDPEQFIAIGYLGKTLLSVVYEIRYDGEGEYVWLVTYWESTNRERLIYEQDFY